MDRNGYGTRNQLLHRLFFIFLLIGHFVRPGIIVPTPYFLIVDCDRSLNQYVALRLWVVEPKENLNLYFSVQISNPTPKKTSFCLNSMRKKL